MDADGVCRHGVINHLIYTLSRLIDVMSGREQRSEAFNAARLFGSQASVIHQAQPNKYERAHNALAKQLMPSEQPGTSTHSPLHFFLPVRLVE